MKKILLLLVSCLLIACMAGSAMAIGLDTSQLPVDEDSGLPYIVIVPNSDTSSFGDLAFTVDSGLNGNYKLTVQVLKGDIQARIVNLNLDSMATFASLSGGSVEKTWNLNSGNHPCQLEVKGNTVGVIKVSGIGPDNSEYPQEVKVFVKSEIPEFPTLALPVAAILGLVFIFGRKKEGL